MEGHDDKPRVLFADRRTSVEVNDSNDVLFLKAGEGADGFLEWHTVLQMSHAEFREVVLAWTRLYHG